MQIDKVAEGNQEAPALPEPFEMTATGMVVRGHPSIEDWIKFGDVLYGIRTGLQWTIGDWINYGEDRADWGEKYDQALSRYDYTYGYLRVMASVARKFPCNARITNLSWSHHQTVAALAEGIRSKALAEAVEKSLSRDDLRDRVIEIKSSLVETDPNKSTPETPPDAPIVLTQKVYEPDAILQCKEGRVLLQMLGGIPEEIADLMKRHQDEAEFNIQLIITHRVEVD